MKNKVRKIFSMIGCVFSGGKVILITIEDFSKLADKYMSSLDPMHQFSFKAAVGKNTLLMAANENLGKWESLFLEKFSNELQNRQFDALYAFDKDDTKKHINAYLESYRFSYKKIDFSIEWLHDSSDRVVRISVKEKQSMLDKVMNRYGMEILNINFLFSEIVSLSGSSLDFLLKLDGCTYRFNSKGVSQLST